MKSLIILIAFSTAILHGQDITKEINGSRGIWRASIASLAAANAFDIHSSWGKHELNSNLSGPNGNFGARGALLKLGMQGGLIGLEFLLTRGHPTGKLYRRLAFINFVGSSAISAVTIHNYMVPRPR